MSSSVSVVAVAYCRGSGEVGARSTGTDGDDISGVTVDTDGGVECVPVAVHTRRQRGM